MKLKKTNVPDQCGSDSQVRAVVRETLWGLVEKTARREAKCVDVIADLPSDFSTELPIQFSSKNNLKRKRKEHQDVRSTQKSAHQTAIILPIPPYNGTLLEWNVYKVCKTAHNYIRVIGVGPSLPTGRYSMVRVIGNRFDDHMPKDDSATILEVDRLTQLVELHGQELLNAHKLVQRDEARILAAGAPEGVHLKYWDQRYRILSRFDKGVRLDAESWYSITPEAVARHVTASCIGRARERKCGAIEMVLDCFSGCGGNTIPFAAQGKRVVSVDIDPQKLEYLR